jgi:lipopolysaccharide/colanic/teichoic acid biosynthesis glycosyltransferase
MIYRRYGKRCLDICFAILLLTISAPLFLLLAVIIKIDSAGPIFYRAARAGKSGRVFRMWKLRTMVTQADSIGPGLTAMNDHRITRVGRLLRRLSLDEIPQLLNVLCGQMSLVGPRPEIPDIVVTYSDEQKNVLTVRPGLTGYSQINGRDDLPFIPKLRLENEYVAKISLLFDLKIILFTVPAVLRGIGARY